MTLAIGDRLPDGQLTRMGEKGPETTTVKDLFDEQKTVLFGLPGAFTRTCSTAHLPSFVRTASQLRDKGVDRIVCVAVNDALAMQMWDESVQASQSGVELWADMDGSFIKSIGMDFDAPAVGFFGRSLRFSALIEDRIVTIINQETQRGVCEATAGETMLGQI